MAKTSFLGHFGPFLTVFGVFSENDVIYQKSAWCIFSALNVPYFMQNFRKIVGAVSEIIRYVRTNERTDGGEIIGPFGFQPGTNKRQFLGLHFSYR